MKQEETYKILRENGIKNPEDPSKRDILRLLELEAQNKIDSKLIQEYFNLANTAVPKLFDTLKSLAKEHVSKEYIESINKRIDVLNREYEKASTQEQRDRNHEEIHKLYKLIKEESDEQRNFLLKLGFGALGTVVVIGGVAISIRNKEAGQKIIQGGIETIKRIK